MNREKKQAGTFELDNEASDQQASLDHSITFRERRRAIQDANHIAKGKNEYFAPLYKACAENGIKRKMARQLATEGILDCFYIGTKPYVVLTSLTSLQMRCQRMWIDV